MPFPNHAAERGFPELARAALDELGTLVSAQGRLLRLELAADVRHTGRRAVGVLVFAPLLLVGYVLVMVGLAHWLASPLGVAGAFLLIGGLHAVGAGVGLTYALRTFTDVRALGRSREEIKLTVDQVQTAVESASGGSHA